MAVKCLIFSPKRLSIYRWDRGVMCVPELLKPAIHVSKSSRSIIYHLRIFNSAALLAHSSARRRGSYLNPVQFKGTKGTKKLYLLELLPLLQEVTSELVAHALHDARPRQPTPRSSSRSSGLNLPRPAQFHKLCQDARGHSSFHKRRRLLKG
jgi:hypothetical protein